MNFGLTENQLHTIQSVFEKYPIVDEVFIYGSRAKGNFSERSDVDLAVVTSESDRFTLSKIQIDFYESDIPFLFDIQDFKRLKNQDLIEHIQRIGKRIYKK